ncbi:ubiquitin carboxyl-terminal hydrolase 31-like [Diadema antillarum]|uniref:ubiquitin carboxyl-terminal hydrolase 31-like n=1 Tax=Diadema antillarum TaxID=105358 RepID=UPI003A861E9A
MANRSVYGRSVSDAALNESGGGQQEINGSTAAAMPQACARVSRGDRSYGARSTTEGYVNGYSRQHSSHMDYNNAQWNKSRAPPSRHAAVAMETHSGDELWKRKTASLPRSVRAKGRTQRHLLNGHSYGDVNPFSYPHSQQQAFGTNQLHRYTQREDMHEVLYHRENGQREYLSSVTRAASFHLGSEDYAYRASQTIHQSQSGSRLSHTESRTTSIQHSSGSVGDDRYRGYNRESSPRPILSRSVSSSNTPTKHSSGSDHDDSLNSSFSSSVGSPGKKKLSRKPSFKAFGSLIQKMVRQIGSMEDTKSSGPSQEQEGLAGSVIANGDAEQFSPMSPPCSPVLLHGRVPGLSGLRNHGNTCFMNAIVQCLSNTDLLAEYFVLEQYRSDLHRTKKVSKKFGTKGEVTEQLAVLLRAIWGCKYSPHHTTEFKRTVAKHGSQYRGNEQHDAQEFLIWLLDKVHEDLNSAAKKKYKQLKNGQNKNDELLAAESLANHMRRNNSFVHDLFQAQYRSSLTCPHCGVQSNTFDPFVCVSLPIPQRTTRVVMIVVIYADRDPRAERFGIVLEASSTVADLRSTIASTCSIAVTRIVLTEVYIDGFYRSFSDVQPLADIHDGDSVYAVETPHNPHSMLQNSQVKPYLHVHCSRPIEVITMVVINQQGTGRSGKRFGQPMAIEVDRSVSNNQLILVILRAMGCTHVEKIMQTGPVLRLGIVLDAKGSRHYIPVEEARPLHNPTITRMLQATSEEGGPPHVKAIVEWERDFRFTFSQRALSIYIEEHESVQRERSTHQQPVRADLFDCIDLYTQEEKLGEDNAWHCSHCRRLQQGTKKLTLWSLPDVLILHLKRFKQVGATRTKLSTQVDFPIHNLNMGQYLEHRRQSQGLATNGNAQAALLNSLTSWSPWKQQSGRGRSSTLIGDYVYDLYAVCNHSGSLSGGHYTAYCRNSLDGQWYHFDDAKVTLIPEERLVSKAAYLLFYQRRTHTAGSTTSTDGSMSSSGSDHWVHRMPAYIRQCSNTSSGQDSVFSSGGSSHGGNSPTSEMAPVEGNGHWGFGQAKNGGEPGHKTGGAGQPDLPEWYNQNGVDRARDGVEHERSKVSGRLTPGHRSWQGSRDLIDDDDSGGFDAHQRPFVRSVAGNLRSPLYQRDWQEYESDNDSVLTESCV